MEIVWIILGAASSAFAAFSFFKAGKFKLTASKEVMLQAGFGWMEKQPVASARTIAILEILGAIGVVVAPITYYLGLDWAIWFAVAAGTGLALTMLAATLLHNVRGEGKYTNKMTLGLLAVSLVSAVSWAAIAIG